MDVTRSTTSYVEKQQTCILLCSVAVNAG